MSDERRAAPESRRGRAPCALGSSGAIPSASRALPPRSTMHTTMRRPQPGCRYDHSDPHGQQGAAIQVDHEHRDEEAPCPAGCTVAAIPTKRYSSSIGPCVRGHGRRVAAQVLMDDGGRVGPSDPHAGCAGPCGCARRVEARARLLFSGNPFLSTIGFIRRNRPLLSNGDYTAMWIVGRWRVSRE